jgi:hypothetical protein
MHWQHLPVEDDLQRSNYLQFFVLLECFVEDCPLRILPKFCHSLPFAEVCWLAGYGLISKTYLEYLGWDIIVGGKAGKCER